MPARNVQNAEKLCKSSRLLRVLSSCFLGSSVSPFPLTIGCKPFDLRSGECAVAVLFLNMEVHLFIVFRPTLTSWAKVILDAASYGWNAPKKSNCTIYRSIQVHKATTNNKLTSTSHIGNLSILSGSMGGISTQTSFIEIGTFLARFWWMIASPTLMILQKTEPFGLYYYVFVFIFSKNLPDLDLLPCVFRNGPLFIWPFFNLFKKMVEFQVKTSWRSWWNTSNPLSIPPIKWYKPFNKSRPLPKPTTFAACSSPNLLLPPCPAVPDVWPA